MQLRRTHCRPSHRIWLALFVAAVASLLRVATLHAQEPTPTPAPVIGTLPITASAPITATLGLTGSAEMTSARDLLVTEQAPPFEYEPAFVEEECPFIVPWNQEIICGRLGVPENRDDPEAETISLFIAILKSLGRPELDPVLVLPGGPGSDATSSRQVFYTLPFRQNRDIILLDARGTGQSQPSLNCPELDEVGTAYVTYADAYLACHTRLVDEGRDLAGYTTAESVEDIADMAKVLGIGKLNLYATAYGARAAVHLADRHPSLVRSMVLDGVLPVNAQALLEEPLNLYGAIQRVALDCAATPACNGNFPALEARMLEVVDRYNRAPLAALGYGTGDDILKLIYEELDTGGARVPALITALYNEEYRVACETLPPAAGCWLRALMRFEQGELPQSSGAAPAEVHVLTATVPVTTTAVVTGWRDLFVQPDDPTGPDAERISWLMQELGLRRPGELFDYLDTLERDEVEALLSGFPSAITDSFSEGVFASVECAEEAPFYTLDDVREIAARIPAQFGTLPIERAAEVGNICHFWDVPAVSPASKIVQALQTPALVVSGTHDPITPPVWARRAAASMDAVTLRLFPGYGHGVLALDDGCLQGMMAAFYTIPTRQPDTACVDTRQIDWHIPEQ